MLALPQVKRFNIHFAGVGIGYYDYHNVTNIRLCDCFANPHFISWYDSTYCLQIFWLGPKIVTKFDTYCKRWILWPALLGINRNRIIKYVRLFYSLKTKGNDLNCLICIIASSGFLWCCQYLVRLWLIIAKEWICDPSQICATPSSLLRDRRVS